MFLFINPIPKYILGASQDTIEPTRAYLKVIIGFSCIMILQIILPALLRSEGKVKTSCNWDDNWYNVEYCA